MREATLQKKVDQVQDTLGKYQASNSIVFVDYIGLTVEEITDFRKQLHAEACSMHVIKNNILRRAAAAAKYEGLEEALKGPSAVVLSADGTAAARVTYKYAKTNKKLVVKGGVINGEVVALDELAVLATLPDKNGMLSMLLSVLEAPMRNMALVVKAVAEQKEEQLS